MIVYEVNLIVRNEIVEKFKAWLHSHVMEMLDFDGFDDAELVPIEQHDKDSQLLTVRYFVESQKKLDDYIENHAEKMRADGLEKFPNQFSATRRIYPYSEQ